MKNLLKKLLLLFVIGMLGQTYIDNTCWASKRSVNPKTAENDAIAEKIRALKTPRKHAGKSGFISKEVKHSTTGAILLLKGDKIVEEYKLNYNFVACGKNWKCTEIGCNLCIPCKSLIQEIGKPRLHSEISFLQHICNSENPLEDINKNSIFKYFLDKQEKDSSYKIVIILNNSGYDPCKLLDDGLTVATKIEKNSSIPCNIYLHEFCKNFKVDIWVRYPNKSAFLIEKYIYNNLEKK